MRTTGNQHHGSKGPEHFPSHRAAEYLAQTGGPELGDQGRDQLIGQGVDRRMVGEPLGGVACVGAQRSVLLANGRLVVGATGSRRPDRGARPGDQVA